MNTARKRQDPSITEDSKYVNPDLFFKSVPIVPVLSPEPNSITEHKIAINEELRDLIPPLKKEEIEQLHKNLDDSRGAREPLVVWENGAGQNDVLVDGHHRFAYCTKQGYGYQVVKMNFLSIEHAKDFMILNQLGKRNMSPDAAKLLRGKLYNNSKKTRAEVVVSGGNAKARKSAGGNSCTQQKQPKTSEVIAKQTGVSPRTVVNDGKFAEAVESLGIEKDVVSGKDKRSAKAIIKAAEEKKSGKKPKPKSNKSVRSTGNEVAAKAISMLKQINPNDEQREEALNKIISYCQKQLTSK